MSRKDYVAIAAEIRAELNAVGTMSGAPDYRQGVIDGIKSAAFALSNVFIAGNPRFDRERFLTACGVN